MFSRRTASFLVAVSLGSIAVAINLRAASAQTTVFTYQAILTDGAGPASGLYDGEFKLFDTPAVGTGTQIGSTIQRLSVSVTNGIFTAQLDFGSCATCFNGASRYLEIAIRPSGGSTFTTLSPRQPITSTPYSMKALNATTADGLSIACVNCIISSQIASVSGSTVTGTIPVASVPAGSLSYIQNTSSQQASSNFNISGNGTAGGTLSSNVVNATTQYNINGNRVLSSAGTQNLFAGVGAGQMNAASYNSFFGFSAGSANTTGDANSFFGESSGLSNTTGHYNSFFGTSAGRLNTTGFWNSFFGTAAGYSNTTGENNSFFGQAAGYSSTTGARNSFFGSFAGTTNTTGTDNSFFGYAAGGRGGNKNSFFGSLAGADATGTGNSFFGFQAGRRSTTGVNNSFYGQSSGFSNTTGYENVFFGDSAGYSNTGGRFNAFFGNSAGHDNTIGQYNTFIGVAAGYTNRLGILNSFFGSQAGISNADGSQNTIIGSGADVGSDSLVRATAIGAEARVDQSDSLVLGRAGTKVGIGTTAPFTSLDVRGDLYVGLSDTSGVHIQGNNFYLANDFGDAFNSFRLDGYQNNLYLIARSVPGSGAGAGIVFRTASAGAGEIDRVAIDQNGIVYVNNLASGVNTTQLCRNFSNQLASCSSSLRYKTDLRPFTGGLSIIDRLRPISFTWKRGGVRDVGLGAEDVARVEPLFTFTDAAGEIEGVKYDQLSVVFINAIKEQQAEINGQKKQIGLLRDQAAHDRIQISRLQEEIEALKQIVWSRHPTSGLSKSGRSVR